MIIRIIHQKSHSFLGISLNFTSIRVCSIVQLNLSSYNNYIVILNYTVGQTFIEAKINDISKRWMKFITNGSNHYHMNSTVGYHIFEIALDCFT